MFFGSLLLSGAKRAYATWNPSDKSASITLSGGNLTASQTTAGMVRSTISKISGKWYWEVTCATTNNAHGVANSSANLSSYLASDANGWSWSSLGGCYHNNALAGTNSAYTTGDVIGFALDMGAGTLTMFKNGVQQSFVHTGVTGNIFAAFGNSAVSSSSTANFGASAFSYSPPSGHNPGIYS